MLRCSHATSTTPAGDARIFAAACRFPSCVCVSCSGCRGNASFSLTYFNVSWSAAAAAARDKDAYVDVLTLEKHRAKKVCPLHFLDVVVSHAQCKAMGRAWKSQFEGRGTRLLYLDDESYASDEAKPLPE